MWTYIFELAFLHEPLEMWSLAGTGLILGYMLVVAAIKMIESGVLGGEKEEEVGLLMEEPKSEYQSLQQQQQEP